MHRSSLILLFAVALVASTTQPALGDELDDRIAELRLEAEAVREQLEPLAAPLLIEDADLRLWMSGGFLGELFNWFNHLPKAERTVRFRSTGQQEPLLRGGSAWPLHCGYRISLRDAAGLRIDAVPRNLGAEWNGFGAYELDGRLGVDGELHFGWEIDLTHREFKCETQIYEDCGYNASRCGYDADDYPEWCCWTVVKTRCYYYHLPCDQGVDTKSGAGGGPIDILLPRLCSGEFCPELTVRPLAGIEVSILRSLAEQPAPSRQALADRLDIPLAELYPLADLLVAAGLVAEDGRLSASESGVLFAEQPARGFLHYILQAKADPVEEVKICPWLAILRPCFTTEVSLPSGYLYAGVSDLGLSQEYELPFPDYHPWPEPISMEGARGYRWRFTPNRTVADEKGLELRGDVEVDLVSAAAWDEYLQVHFIDTGHGDAIWIRGPKGEALESRSLLIDGGPDRDRPATLPLDNRLPVYLQRWGLEADESIDYLLLSHPGAHHYRGLFEVLDRYQVATIAEPGLHRGRGVKRWLEAAAAETADGEPTRLVDLSAEPLAVSLGPGVEVSVLYSYDPEIATGWGRKGRKNASAVVLVQYGDFRLLLMADALAEVERHLLEDPQILRSAVIKLGNHASPGSSLEDFLAAVDPDAVVVMAGGRGSRKRAREIDRIRRLLPGTRVLRTDAEDAAEGRGWTDDFDGDDIFLATDGDGTLVFRATRVAEGDVLVRRWTAAGVLGH